MEDGAVFGDDELGRQGPMCVNHAPRARDAFCHWRSQRLQIEGCDDNTQTGFGNRFRKCCERISEAHVAPRSGKPDIPAEMVDESLTRDLGNGGYIAAGVEFDAMGRRAAYYVQPHRPTELFPTAGEPIRVPASDRRPEGSTVFRWGHSLHFAQPVNISFSKRPLAIDSCFSPAPSACRGARVFEALETFTSVPENPHRPLHSPALSATCLTSDTRTRSTAM
ncbi:Phage portal protein, lambda family [Roseovarius marisflavi]|uniref:Phage portal protein, lambda family n=1 Tax=Roseovarius marisflavi TaxID=1054996 RepID=A0A1M6XMZ8_9RHOB|nr:Phage portal protein, lambda family [Roseovarius marisflavi]